jgi:threonine synthase
VLGHDVDDPQTVATAIRIGRPASGSLALQARDESSGLIDSVSDAQILAAYRDLARLEGIFCEPASAASVAGVRKAAADGRIDPGATIVAVLTGLGLKDPDTGMTLATAPLEAEPSVESVRDALGW